MLVKHNVVVPIKRGDVFTISTSRRDGTVLKRDIVVIMHDDMIIRRKKILCANIYDDEPEHTGENGIGLVQFIKDDIIKTIHLDETCFKDIGSLMDMERSYSLSSSVLELCNNELLKLINPIDTQFKQLPMPEVVEKVIEEEEPVIRRPLIKPVIPPKKQEVVEPPKEEAKIEYNIKDGKILIPKIGITLNDIAKAGNVELSLVRRNVIASLRSDIVPERTTLLTQEEAIKICNRMKIPFIAEREKSVPVASPKKEKGLSNKVKTLIESPDFIETAEMYKDGTISAKDAVEILNISPYQFRYAYSIWKLNFDEEVEVQTKPEVEEQPVVASKQKDPREELLKDLNVIIIGGTDIWHNKLKAMFPKWEYVRASAPTNKVVNVSRRDLIYIFDKHLSHATWYAYQKACKSAGKEWKFLKRVSIPDNINTFYNDAVERGLITKEV